METELVEPFNKNTNLHNIYWSGTVSSKMGLLLGLYLRVSAPRKHGQNKQTLKCQGGKSFKIQPTGFNKLRAGLRKNYSKGYDGQRRCD